MYSLLLYMCIESWK